MEEKKMGRPRKYEGDERQRRRKASAIYQKKSLKQLNVRISFELFQELKTKAKEQNLSVRKFIIQKISE